jgi:hypothetical protein
MKKELENGKSDFMCVCNMCSNYTNCLANEKEQEKFIQEVCLDKSSAEVFTWVTAILIGVFLGYCWHYLAVQTQIAEKDAQIRQYQIAIEDAQSIQKTKEWQAIEKCKDGEYWKAECIAWELNNEK